MRTKLGAVALIAAMSCGAAWAQSNPFAGQTPVNTELKKSISSRDKVGAEISATTNQDVMIGTVKLPKGSTLLGHIVDATRHSKDEPNGSVTIVFDHAQPKKGDPMPIWASVYKLMPADDSMQRADAPGMKGQSSEQNAAIAMRPATDANSKVVSGMVSPSSAPIQVASYIPGVAISAVASKSKSAIFGVRNADVDLLAGMHLVIGVAPGTN